LSSAKAPWFFLRQAWNDFFHSPVSPQICGILRIGFGLLVFIDFLVLFRDVDRWFGPGGMLTFDASRAIVDADTITIFQWFPDSWLAVHVCYVLLLIQSLCLAAGFFGRFNAACVFVLVTSFNHRNMALFDAEDNLLRIACFLLIFMPLDDAFSLRNLLDHSSGRPLRTKTFPAWPLRLLQIEMTLIYLSAALLKLRGEDWRSGSAIHYAVQVDLFRRFPVPQFLVDDLSLGKLATWSILALELALPFGLWIRRTRPFAIAAGILMHLAIEYSMNLFLFEWAMIVGLLSFWPTGNDGAPVGLPRLRRVQGDGVGYFSRSR
jgi:hypothetical protein